MITNGDPSPSGRWWEASALQRNQTGDQRPVGEEADPKPRADQEANRSRPNTWRLAGAGTLSVPACVQ
jgi:hypothetical protein